MWINFLLNIPTINPTSFKSYEREIRLEKERENVARESCKKATELERALMKCKFEYLKYLL